MGWRWRNATQALEHWEHDALDRLLGDRSLLGLRPILLPARADALSDRAGRMQATGELLRVGEF